MKDVKSLESSHLEIASISERLRMDDLDQICSGNWHKYFLVHPLPLLCSTPKVRCGLREKQDKKDLPILVLAKKKGVLQLAQTSSLESCTGVRSLEPNSVTSWRWIYAFLCPHTNSTSQNSPLFKMYPNPTHPSNLNSIITSKKSSLMHPDHLPVTFVPHTDFYVIIIMLCCDHLSTKMWALWVLDIHPIFLELSKVLGTWEVLNKYSQG